MKLTAEQMEELEYAIRHHPQGRVRVKAVALRALGLGLRQAEAARLCGATRQSVAQWARRYASGGLEALRVPPGRGRPRTARDEELLYYALRSPRHFGLDRSYWTLSLLAEVVPSLRGFSASGVQKALARLGLRCQRPGGADATAGATNIVFGEPGRARPVEAATAPPTSATCGGE